MSTLSGKLHTRPTIFHNILFVAQISERFGGIYPKTAGVLGYKKPDPLAMTRRYYRFGRFVDLFSGREPTDSSIQATGHVPQLPDYDLSQRTIIPPS